MTPFGLIVTDVYSICPRQLKGNGSDMAKSPSSVTPEGNISVPISVIGVNGEHFVDNVGLMEIEGGTLREGASLGEVLTEGVRVDGVNEGDSEIEGATVGAHSQHVQFNSPQSIYATRSVV